MVAYRTAGHGAQQLAVKRLREPSGVVRFDVGEKELHQHLVLRGNAHHTRLLRKWTTRYVRIPVKPYGHRKKLDAEEFPECSLGTCDGPARDCGCVE